ncbi:PH domain-containing protein [Flavobacterium sp. ASW18X]|uniref:PH domain-containing protein n=1 Tax=Flavobacterium sp. ASW18X TaxID=2572595 RepID=UPI00146E95CB|nr:PH domain-containing protein [Flavobacterium sp. ASW18X]
MVRFDFNEDYITITKGVFSRERKTIELFRIKDIRESRPFFLRLIGVMNVELITSQKFSRYTTLKGVRKNDFIGILRQNILDQRHRNRVHEIDS